MYLPNVTQRFCTTEMKLQPIFNWWKNNFDEPVEMRIGFRANEMKRAKKMIEKSNENGYNQKTPNEQWGYKISLKTGDPSLTIEKQQVEMVSALFGGR